MGRRRGSRYLHRGGSGISYLEALYYCRLVVRMPPGVNATTILSLRYLHCGEDLHLQRAAESAGGEQ